MDDDTRHEVDVDGATIAYRRFGPRDAPPLLLVHGGGAHGAWFAGVIPHLVDDHHLVVPDLSGHGESGRRQRYRPATWEAELAAVIEDAGVGPLVVVGHSMGGFVTAHLAGHRPHLVTGAVIIDTPFRSPAPDGKRPRWRKERRPHRVYPTFEEARRRFRYVPDQPVVDAELTEVIAAASITAVPDGFSWKADPQVYGRFDDRDTLAALARIEAPVAYLYGEHSALCDADTAAFLTESTPGDVESSRIDGAHHHVVIDRPDACATHVRGFLERHVRLAGRGVT